MLVPYYIITTTWSWILLASNFKLRVFLTLCNKTLHLRQVLMFPVKKWLFRQLYKITHVLVTFEVLWLRQGILITHKRWGNLTGINVKLGAWHNKKVIFQMGWRFIIFCCQEFCLQKYFAHVSDPDPIAAATRSAVCVQQCYWLNVCVWFTSTCASTYNAEISWHI
jgi:hypothetical protein